MSLTLDNLTVQDSDWIDLTVTHPGTANATIDVQCKSRNGRLLIVFGTSTKPSTSLNDMGLSLGPFEAYRGTASNVWLRGSGGPVVASVTIAS